MPSPDSPKRQALTARLAAALKKNLEKRKRQAQARKAAGQSRLSLAQKPPKKPRKA
jgi:hypothetical protein